MRVSPATDVQDVIARVRLALDAADHPDTALPGLLADTATRLQTELVNSGTHGDTVLSLQGLSINVTTRDETTRERVLNALFKNRLTFV